MKIVGTGHPGKPDAAATDAEIEAIVAEAIAAEAAMAREEAAPPSSAIVWWRAQMRARQEAAQLADRPITVVHALAIACGAGLLLSVVGYVAAGVRGSAGWLSSVYASIAAAAAPLAAHRSLEPLDHAADDGDAHLRCRRVNRRLCDLPR